MILMALIVTAALVAMALPAHCQTVVINEVVFDDASTDDRNYIEIFGPGGTSLAGFRLDCMNGPENGCEIYRSIDLSAYTIPVDGYLVLAQSADVPNADDVHATNFNFQNGPDGLLLIEGDTVVDGFCYGAMTCQGCEGAPVSQSTGSDTESWGRNPDGHDTNDNAADFHWLPTSPGTSNASPATWTPTPTPTPSEGSPVPSSTPIYQLKINEVVFDDAGTDDRNYIEILGPPNLLLTGYQLACINGPENGCAPYNVVNLSSYTIPADGFLVLAQSADVPNADAVSSTNFNFQNGPDGLLLMFGEQVIDGFCYGEMTCDGCEGSPITPITGTDTDSWCRSPDGFDTNDNASDFHWLPISPGLPNATAPTGTPILTATPTPTPGDETPTPTRPPTDRLTINEVVFDDVSTDDRNFVEIYGPPRMPLTGYRLVGIKGPLQNCEDYLDFDLGSYQIPADGFLVIAQNENIPNADIYASSSFIQNGPNGLLLMNGDVVVDGFCYGKMECPGCEGNPITPQTATDTDSWSRHPDGHDTDDNAEDFLWLPISPGMPNIIPPSPTPAPTPEDRVVINELIYDDAGTEDRNLIELYGVPGLSLDNILIVAINGGTGGINPSQDFVIPLTGYSLGSSGHFVVAQSAAIEGADLVTEEFSPQGGPDMILLRYGDADNGPILDALAYGEFEGPPPFGEGSPHLGVKDSDTESLSRCPDGRDTNDNAADFFRMNVSAGLANGPCPPTHTPTCIPEPTWTATPTPVLQISGRLIITEILASSYEDTRIERAQALEVLNLTNQPFDLTACLLLDSGETPDNIIAMEDGPSLIPPHHFGVILPSSYPGSYEPYAFPSIEDGCVLFQVANGQLGSNGLTWNEEVALLDARGEMITRFRGVRWMPVEGQSVERIDVYGADDDPDNWRPSECLTTSLRERHSLGRHTCRPPFIPWGELIITEVQILGTGEDSLCKIAFVEVLALGPEPTLLDNLYLHDGDTIDRIIPLRGCDLPLLLPGQLGLILDKKYLDNPIYQDSICENAVLLTTEDGTIGNGLSSGEPVIIFNPDWRTRAATALKTPSRDECQSVERIFLEAIDSQDKWVPANCAREVGWHSAGRPNCASPPLANLRPVIQFAGFGHTYLSAHLPGTFEAHALIAPGLRPDGSHAPIARVELLYSFSPVMQLYKSSQPNYFSLQIPIPAGVLPPANLPIDFQLRAVDEDGRTSLYWPFLQVRGPELGCPEPYEYGFYGAENTTGAKPTALSQLQNTAQSARTVPLAPIPVIFAGGFELTDINSITPCELQISAVPLPSASSPLSRVEVFYAGIPTGVLLNDQGVDGDYAAADGVFSVRVPIDPQQVGLEAGMFLLNIVARTADGQSSDPWPRLIIH